jgi:hypothetical protein
MSADEQTQFTHVLFDHKHLWIAFQETRHLRKFPQEIPAMRGGSVCLHRFR